MKTAEQERARQLRSQGWSVAEIERELQVARSSVSRWVRNVELTAVQRRALSDRITQGRLGAGARQAAAARLLRAAHQAEGRRRAQIGDPSYAAGCMLYWAEGDKCRGRVALSNADVEVLRYFAFFLRHHFSVPNARMRVHCYLFADHVDQQREVEEFWLTNLGLTRTSLMKSTVNNYSRSSQKKRVNKLPYGTCALIVNSTRIAQTIYGSIQEYGGFERPEWLD